MHHDYRQHIIAEYHSFLKDDSFPCVAARAALAKGQVKCMVAAHMGCPVNDAAIVAFLYDFIDQYRSAETSFHSAAILFAYPETVSEEEYEKMMWHRLQAISDIDATRYNYDKRVDTDTGSSKFSFSLKEEAFFVIGLHPGSSRPARRFKYPAIVFNPHAEFEKLRLTTGYDKMKNIVRKRDLAYSGSLNPMLNDHGKTSEVLQYSGRIYEDSWKCPLNIKHGSVKNNSAT